MNKLQKLIAKILGVDKELTELKILNNQLFWQTEELGESYKILQKGLDNLCELVQPSIVVDLDPQRLENSTVIVTSALNGGTARMFPAQFHNINELEAYIRAERSRLKIKEPAYFDAPRSMEGFLRENQSRW